MNKDKFGAKDRVEELGPKEMQTIDSVMSNPQLFIDTYNTLTRVIYPEIDRNKVKSIKEEMDKIEANLSRAHIGKGIRLIIYNRLNNKFLMNLLKKEKETELLEEASFLEDINTTVLAVYPSDIDMKMVEKYMKETEDMAKHLNDNDKWLAYNLLGTMYFNDFIKNFAGFYPR